jgi:hypothetical protein
MAGLGSWAAAGMARAGDPSPPAADAVTTEARPRLLLIGDSMIAGGFGLFLARALEADHGVEVIRQGKTSTGLARPDFYDWIDVGARLREKEQPTAVAVMFGGNDGQGLHMGRDADPEWIRWQDPGWTPEYRRRVDALADAVAPVGSGVGLFWIGMPVMGLERLHERVRHMNVIYRAQMAIRAHSEFIDIWDALAEDYGRFARTMIIDGKRRFIRSRDGVHLSTTGAHYLVRNVAPRIGGMMNGRGMVRGDDEPPA